MFHSSPIQSTYKFHVLLGSGITGKVYLAIDAHGNKVAIKSMVRKHIPTISLRETEIMKSYSRHPNVVTLLDRFDEPDTLHLVLNYIGKDNLMTHVNREGAFSEIEARNLFEGMILGLDHLHNSGIVHRDIKCENILLTSDLKPVICDLGFGAYWKKGGRLFDFCGSFHYAAPEILGKRPYEGPEIDIWSIGVVLFAIIARQLPWDGTRDEMIQCISTGDYWVLEYFSHPLTELLDNILQPIPHARWGISQIKESKWFTGDTASMESQRCIPVSFSIASSVGGPDAPSLWNASGRYSGRSLFSSKRSNGPERIERSGRFTLKKKEEVPETPQPENLNVDDQVEEVPELNSVESEAPSSPEPNHEVTSPKDPDIEEKMKIEKESGDTLTGLEDILSKLDEKKDGRNKFGANFDQFSNESESFQKSGHRTSVDLGQLSSWKSSRLTQSSIQKNDSPKKSKNPFLNLYARFKHGRSLTLSTERENSAPDQNGLLRRMSIEKGSPNSQSPTTKPARVPIQRYETH